MKRVVSLAFVFLTGSGSIAQEEPLDPFEKKPAVKEEREKARSPEDSIVVMVEFIEAPKEKTRRLLRDTPDTEKRWGALQDWIASGEARILDSTLAITRSGRRVRVESIYELNRPTRRLENPAAPEAPPFPSAFDLARPGLALEADPVFSSDRTARISLELERSEFAIDTDHPDLVESGEIQKGDFIDAVFREQSVKQVESEVKEGERRLLGTLEPLAADRREHFSVLAFLRWGRSRAIPLRRGTVAPPHQALKLRFEWIEVDAGTWHELALGNEPSLLADESWKTVGEWLKEKRARTLHTLSFDCASGQRTRIGTGDRVTYHATYSPPSVPGGASMAENPEFRYLGANLEIKPELNPSGIVTVRANPEITSHRDDLVYYRRRTDEGWVPTVRMPLTFCHRTIATFPVGPSARVLMGVFTPPADEIGKLDAGRKILLFLHNDTRYPEDEENGGPAAP